MLNYSLSPSPFPNSSALYGASLQVGTKYFIHYTPVATGELLPYSFWLNGVKINSESQAPYELNGGAGYNFFVPSNSTLAVKNKNGVVLETVNFTVGTVTPPPPPNPTLKTIILKLKSDGSQVMKVEYDETKCELVQ